MAVLDEGRRSLEAWVGIEAAAAARDIALRAHTIQQDGLFVVATRRRRPLPGHPLVVGEPRIRFLCRVATRHTRWPRRRFSRHRPRPADADLGAAGGAGCPSQAAAQLELRRNLRELARVPIGVA